MLQQAPLDHGQLGRLFTHKFEGKCGRKTIFWLCTRTILQLSYQTDSHPHNRTLTHTQSIGSCIYKVNSVSAEFLPPVARCLCVCPILIFCRFLACTSTSSHTHTTHTTHTHGSNRLSRKQFMFAPDHSVFDMQTAAGSNNTWLGSNLNCTASNWMPPTNQLGLAFVPDSHYSSCNCARPCSHWIACLLACLPACLPPCRPSYRKSRVSRLQRLRPPECCRPFK